MSQQEEQRSEETDGGPCAAVERGLAATDQEQKQCWALASYLKS